MFAKISTAVALAAATTANAAQVHVASPIGPTSEAITPCFGGNSDCLRYDAVFENIPDYLRFDFYYTPEADVDTFWEITHYVVGTGPYPKEFGSYRAGLYVYDQGGNLISGGDGPTYYALDTYPTAYLRRSAKAGNTLRLSVSFTHYPGLMFQSGFAVPEPGNGYFSAFISVVPEPSALLMFIPAAAIVAARRWKSAQSSTRP